MSPGHYFKTLRQVCSLMKAYMPNHEYHNQRHAKDVFYTANKLAKMEGMSYEDRFALATAALLHDVVFVKGAKDNEEKSAEFAKPYLVKLGYTSGQIEKISELILATKIPTSPRNKLEMIICDADVDNLGREDFLKRGEEVRQELGIADKKKWYDIQVKFLQSHKYYTTTAQKLRNTGVRNNIETITCSDYA